MKTFKGTDKNLKCRDFQYELGKEFVIDGKPIKCTDTGFHACENPLDIFKYYSPNCRYFECESDGEINKDENGDSKIASSKITLLREIKFNDLIKLGIDYIINENNKAANGNNKAANENNKAANENNKAANSIFKSVVTNTDEQSVATNTGNGSFAINTGKQSVATNSGTFSIAANTGDNSAAINSNHRSMAINNGMSSIATNIGGDSMSINSGCFSIATNSGDRSLSINNGWESLSIVDGKDSFACGLGVNNCAKACLGSWLVLTEWKHDKGEWHVHDVKTAIVDGVIVKADTFYILKEGKFVEA